MVRLYNLQNVYILHGTIYKNLSQKFHRLEELYKLPNDSYLITLF